VLLAALYNDYADEDIPDVDPSDLTANEEPAAEPSISHHPAQYLLLTMWCAWAVRVRVLALRPVAVGGFNPRKRHPVDALGGWSRNCCGNVHC
jgi:hypothetical protein